jgi:hypothetical protein
MKFVGSGTSIAYDQVQVRRALRAFPIYFIFFRHNLR